jgi:ribonuclease Y
MLGAPTPVILGGVAVASLVVGVILAVIVANIFGRGLLGRARREAAQTISDAEREAAQTTKEANTTIKEERLELRAQIEREGREHRKEMANFERRLQTREETLDKRIEAVERKATEVEGREREYLEKEKGLIKEREKIKLLIDDQTRKLESISGMSAEEAKKVLFTQLEQDVKRDAAIRLKRVEDEMTEGAEKKAKWVIAQAIQRCAADLVAEATVSVIALPTDEMKGRIIGREGRNIRALESATGINIIIDDTPEAVILSGFDPVRREIARITLERLIQDGRIHPARIEEMVEKVTVEMDKTIKEHGERACMEVDVHGLHPEIVRLMGRLYYRTSYGQNVLKHSQEVCHLAGIMAAELGVGVTEIKRAAFIHDMGKALTHEIEGSHAVNGYEIAKKYGETETVANAVGAHHNEMPQNSICAVLVQAADALSAARPGARRETVELYIKRLEQLEELADAFPGVEKSYALQAGREVRVVVYPERVNDGEAAQLARDIARKVESDMTYPGQIRVTVIRETRAVETAS